MRHEQQSTQVGTENKYGYNGKELNDDFDLNLHDYGARWYDASIGRWHSINPLADDASNISWSTYNYVINNPLRYIDPDGKRWINPYKEFLKRDESVKRLTMSQQLYIAALSYKVEKAINTLRKNDESLYDFIENYSQGGTKVNVPVYISMDALSPEGGEGTTNYTIETRENGNVYIRGGEINGGFAGQDLIGNERLGTNIINIALYQSNEQSDVVLANEAGDVMFTQDIERAKADATENEGGVYYDFDSTHYSFNVEEIYKASKNGKMSTTNIYPLTHKKGSAESITKDGKYSVNHLDENIIQEK